MERYITLSIPINKWQKVVLWCNTNNVIFVDKGIEYGNRYFNINGSTDTYNSLKISVPEIRLNGLAKLGNILDCDTDLLHDFSGILEAERKAIENAQFAEHWLVLWLLKVDSVEALREVQNYDELMTVSSRRLIEERIKTLEGKPGNYEIFLQNKLAEQSMNN